MLYFTLFFFLIIFFSRFGFSPIVYCCDLKLCCVLLTLCNPSSWKALFQLETSSFCISSSAGLLLLSPFTLFEIQTHTIAFSKRILYFAGDFRFLGPLLLSFPLYVLYKNTLFWVSIVLIHCGNSAFFFVFVVFLGSGNSDFWWNSFSFPSKSKR